MFKMKKNEQNENILCLKGMRRFRIMFTIFKFQPKTVENPKIFSKNEQNNEHYRQLNPKVKFDGPNKK